ncbi:hypothetical protein ABZ845_27470 [Streptomyces sp. NPDC047022]|uniref:hypothetical protein n=1 Tax=Streptomyces sp. NPDC047022 TaxID=3155737 RepID=UPI00340576AD
MSPLWIERAPGTRHGTAVAGFLWVGVAPTVFFATAPVSALATTLGVACAVALGIGLAVRIERALVYADEEAVLLRNYLWTRRIALADVVGVEGNTLFWCGPRGRLRTSRLAALSAPISRFPVPSAAKDLNRLEQVRMQAWIEQAVGVRIKRRARLVGHLDDAALAREVRVSAAGVRWEGRRRWLGLGQPRPRWGVLQAAAEQETAARTS